MAYLRCTDTLRQTTKDIPLRKPLVTIGRVPGNDVVLEDQTVGATHANLLRSGKTVTLNAVDAKAEIYVNGKKVRSREIAIGDKILIGRFEIEMLDGSPSASLRTPENSTESLEKLVDFAAQLMREESPERLFEQLLESVVSLTGAEKGFVIVLRDGERQLAAAHNVVDDQSDLSRVSDTIIDQVIEHRRPVIVSDAMRDRKFGQSRSVVDLKLSSVMCVPLMFRNDLLGVLYLGNDAITGLFTEDDLTLLQVWAAQASVTVHAALLLNQLKTTNRNLREQLRRTSQGNIIGSSPGMKAVFRMIRRIAPTDISALLLGETGTGKEMVAKEIHRLSGRAKQPFVSINCGAIPENLLESELFGHKKGSFTGAVTDKIGKFESATGGTLFLDEIGEMPMNLQVKLLRVL
jgi:transcriptional regulator with GAF, ATPase, and Fis domain